MGREGGICNKTSCEEITMQDSTHGWSILSKIQFPIKNEKKNDFDKIDLTSKKIMLICSIRVMLSTI